MDKTCPRCRLAKPAREFYKNVARRDGLSPYCVECSRLATNESYARLKAATLEHLGGACRQCGYHADPRALVIDHINGNGGVERKSGHGMHRTLLHAAIADDGSHYQLLCANCNTIKRIELDERGSRTYTRSIPTERLVPPDRRGSPEIRALRAEHTRKLWEDPAHREWCSQKYSEAMKRRWQSGEVPNRPKEML